MRKIALLLAFLLAAGSAGVFAETAISTDFSISGDASVKFAYDLATGGFGFTNSATGDISLTLASGDATNDPGSGWRGVISLTGFKIDIGSGAGADFTGVTGLNDAEFLLLDDATAADADVVDATTADEATLLETATADSDILVTDPSVEAYITNGDIKIWVYDHPTNKATQVAAVEDADSGAENKDSDIGTDLSENGGVKVAFGFDPVDISVGLTTLNDETGDPDDQEFQLSATLDASFDPITVGVSLAQDLGTSQGGATIIGSKVGGTFGPATVSVGVDVDTNAENFEAGGGVDLTVVDGVDVGVDFIYSDNTAVALDAEVAVGLGIIDGLDIDLAAGLYDLAGGDTTAGADTRQDDELDVSIGVDVSFATDALGGSLTTAVGFDTDTINGGDATNGADLTVTLAGQIPNTQFVLAWKDTDLTEFDGAVSFTTKVSY